MKLFAATLTGLLFGAACLGQVPIERRLVGTPERVEPGSELTYPLNLTKLGVTVPRVVGDTAVDRRLHDLRTVYYRLPQVYQQWTPATQTKVIDNLGTTRLMNRPAVWGIYHTSVLHEFNANPDFPWESTFGLNFAHRNKLIGPVYEVFNFLNLPEDEQGRLIPVIVLTDERPIKWLFPPRTMVGEIIYVKYQGVNYVQEIRTRTKSENSTTWHPGVYRPVRDRAEYQALTRTANDPVRRFLHLRNPEEDEVFRVDGTVERLPDLPPEQVKALLQRPFQDVTEANWSPAPDAEFHILPKDYSFGLFKTIDSETCANCHRQTQISVRNLIPKEVRVTGDPTKVGNIRGCDAVFSWHPFDMRSVAHDVQAPPQTVFLRRFDADNRLVQTIARGQAPAREYKITKFVQQSLADYELPQDPRFLHTLLRTCDCGDACPCGKDKCTCGDKCDCPLPKKTVWQPLADNRTVLPALDPSAAQQSMQGAMASATQMAQTAKATKAATQTAKAAVPTSGLRWYVSGPLYYLWDFARKGYIGKYTPQTGEYRTLTPTSEGSGSYYEGPLGTPPIAPPVAARGL